MPSVDLVLAGDSSGGMFLWSPFTTPLGSADREVAPRASFSGHSGEVWALCLTPGPEDAQVTAPKVFSAGEGGKGGAHTGACVQAQRAGRGGGYRCMCAGAEEGGQTGVICADARGGGHVGVPLSLDTSRPQALHVCSHSVAQPCQQPAPQTQRPAHLQPVMSHHHWPFLRLILCVLCPLACWCCFLCAAAPGADHRLVAWDGVTLKEVWRTKLDAKAPLTSLTYSQRCVNRQGKGKGSMRECVWGGGGAVGHRGAPSILWGQYGVCC